MCECEVLVDIRTAETGRIHRGYILMLGAVCTNTNGGNARSVPESPCGTEIVVGDIARDGKAGL
jgi:hypothetical protein